MKERYVIVVAAAIMMAGCAKVQQEEFFGFRLNEPAADSFDEAQTIGDSKSVNDISPDSIWADAMPIGNGRFAAMVFGGPTHERLQLNEGTLYSGEPATAAKFIRIQPTYDKIVSMLREGRYYEAQEIVRTQWLGKQHQNYQPMTDLYLDNTVSGEISAYKRELNFNDAVVTVSYAQNGVNYKREVLASKPDDVIAIRLSADKKKSVSFNAHFGSLHPTAVQNCEDGTLIMKGQAPGYAERRTFKQIESWGDKWKHPLLYDKDGNRISDKTVFYGDEIDGMGMFFDTRVKVSAKGGTVTVDDDGMKVEAADEVLLILSGATSFNGWDKSPSREGVDASAKSEALASAASGLTWKELKARAVADYKADFDKVVLDIPYNKELAARPTDERIASFKDDEDPSLVNLLFQYGRYLMIAGTRPGEQPLNLQGIWNPDIIPPWNSGYTMNINIQMNYWPAEITGLSRYTDTMFRLIREMAESGKETARDMYGRPGWVAHHNVSIWRETYTNDNGVQASFWPMVGGWLCSHLWEHWLFTGDREFLRNEAYPLMKGAAEFYKTWLIEDGKGHLVTPVATSPENLFKDSQGRVCRVDQGTTMDMSILRELFGRIYEATLILGEDKAFGEEVKALADRLLPFQIGSQGQLMEWSKDFEENDPHFGHFSHLYGFYPGDQINWIDTPDLVPAVKKSIEMRGDSDGGWPNAWKNCVWARLLDGDHCYRLLKSNFNSGMSDTFVDNRYHQIDCRFGNTAAIAEMMIQSHQGFVHLLPAMPSAWPEGSVKGLCARGGFECSMQWAGGRMTGATVKSVLGNPCTLVAPVPFSVSGVTAEPYELAGKTWYKVSFDTEAGKTYSLVI